MDSGNHFSENEDPPSCENLNNGHVFDFIVRFGIPKTTDELLSFERCPEGLSRYAFVNSLRALRQKFQNLRKSSYRGGEGVENFRSFSKATYVYPPPAEEPVHGGPKVFQNDAISPRKYKATFSLANKHRE